jgi:thiol-disulfide isomerase/thioredoxin
MIESGSTNASPGAHEPKLARYKAGLAAAALIVVGIAIVGVWYAVQPAAGDEAQQQATASGQALGLARLATPRPVADVAFEDAQGARHSLAEFRSKAVLLNIWATWCAPCRKEMPALDRLQANLGSNAFQVVALSIDRGGVPAVKSFYDEIDIKALPIYVDSTTEAQAKLGVVGVPTTLLIDQEGREVARYTGPAEWDRSDMITLIQRHLPAGKQ